MDNDTVIPRCGVMINAYAAYHPYIMAW